jgi:hypothetical protein
MGGSCRSRRIRFEVAAGEVYILALGEDRLLYCFVSDLVTKLSCPVFLKSLLPYNFAVTLISIFYCPVFLKSP